MLEIRWNQLKSRRLKLIRGVSFEEIMTAEVIRVMSHPKRPEQDIMLLKHKGYIWLVPFVQNENGIFLKTLYPSRKYTKIYLKEGRL